MLQTARSTDVGTVFHVLNRENGHVRLSQKDGECAAAKHFPTEGSVAIRSRVERLGVEFTLLGPGRSRKNWDNQRCLHSYSFAQIASAISCVPTAEGSSRWGFMS